MVKLEEGCTASNWIATRFPNNGHYYQYVCMERVPVVCSVPVKMRWNRFRATVWLFHSVHLRNNTESIIPWNCFRDAESYSPTACTHLSVWKLFMDADTAPYQKYFSYCSKLSTAFCKLQTRNSNNSWEFVSWGISNSDSPTQPWRLNYEDKKNV